MMRMFVIAAALALLAACGSSRYSYEDARKTDTVPAWQRYLDENPETERRAAVDKRIGELKEAQRKREEEQRRKLEAAQRALVAENLRRLDALEKLEPGSSEARFLQTFPAADWRVSKLTFVRAARTGGRTVYRMGLLPSGERSFRKGTGEFFDMMWKSGSDFTYQMNASLPGGRTVEPVWIATVTFDNQRRLDTLTFEKNARERVARASHAYATAR